MSFVLLYPKILNNKIIKDQQFMQKIQKFHRNIMSSREEKRFKKSTKIKIEMRIAKTFKFRFFVTKILIL